MRGSLPGNWEAWSYDVSYQRGESDFVETRDGFTNLNNLQAGINTVSATQCIDALGNEHLAFPIDKNNPDTPPVGFIRLGHGARVSLLDKNLGDGRDRDVVFGVLIVRNGRCRWRHEQHGATECRHRWLLRLTRVRCARQR